MDIFQIIIEFLLNKKVYGPILVIVIAYIVYNLLRLGVRNIINYGKTELEKKRRLTIVKLIENICKYAIFIVAILAILEIFGYNTKAIIASLGVVGAILGLAFQDTIKDFINGVTLIMDNYFIVGDYVKYNDFTGEIISLGLKSTKIRNVDGEIYTIANRNITEIINLSTGKAGVNVYISAAYEHSVEEVEEVINKILPLIQKIKGVEEKSVKYLGVSELANSSVKYLLTTNCKQDDKWQVKRDILRLIKMKFDKNNIKIPYPQVEVHNGKKI